MVEEKTTKTKNKSQKSFFEKVGPFFIILLVLMAFAVGVMWQKISNLEKDATSGTGTTAAATTSTLDVTHLKQYAKDFKLNTKDFNKCLDDGKYTQAVKDDLAYGEQLGVNGTPSFFINGHLMVGALPYDSFRNVFDFILNGGDFSKPTDAIAPLVDGDPNNGEIAVDTVDINLGDSPKDGNDDAAITVVDFSDFQCPYCASFANQTYPQIKSDYIDNGKVRFVFKELPLDFHPYAQKAAEAALCARDQGKYLEYAAKLFSVNSGS